MKDYRSIRFVLIYTMALNLLVTTGKLGVGLWTGSLSLLADGFDSLLNSVFNVVGLVSIYVASRPADPGHPYGHRKFETLSAVSISIFLFVMTLQLGQSAVGRLQDPVMPEVNMWTFAVLALSIAVHLYVARYEERRGRELKSEFLLADARHTRADVLVSLSVAAGLVLVRLGYPAVDAILALVIAGAIAKIGIDIIRDSSKVLADAAALDVALVHRIVANVAGVETVHRIRSRGQEGDLHLDLHVRVRPGIPIEEAHQIAHQVEQQLVGGVAGLRDVVVHVEPQRGGVRRGERDYPRAVRAVAGRVPGAAVHSIQAREIEGRLYVTLHLEVEPSLSMKAGHELASQLEEMLHAEIPGTAAVEVHVEPAARGEEVASRVDEPTYELVAAALAQATEEVGGLSACHQLLVSQTRGRLVVSGHWECDGVLTVAEAHALSRRLEQQILARVPEVGEVTVHVEPRAAEQATAT
jgi:cation diffusion facilitator family transporter